MKELKLNHNITASPLQLRHDPRKDYVPALTKREGWWRCTIRDTPKPGQYNLVTSLDEIEARPNTYRFKTEGRKRDPTSHIGRGQYLLPGAYDLPTSFQVLSSKKSTYAFKNTTRNHADFMNFGNKDKDINVAPNEYQIDTNGCLSNERNISKVNAFKSTTQRFPSKPFTPKHGPGPGHYQNNKSCLRTEGGYSSFKSRTERFSSPKTSVPGPGSYEKTIHTPLTPTLATMGKKYGIFFASAY